MVLDVHQLHSHYREYSNLECVARSLATSRKLLMLLGSFASQTAIDSYYVAQHMDIALRKYVWTFTVMSITLNTHKMASQTSRKGSQNQKHHFMYTLSVTVPQSSHGLQMEVLLEVECCIGWYRIGLRMRPYLVVYMSPPCGTSGSAMLPH